MNFNSFIKPIIKDTIATVSTASRNCYGDITKNAVDQGDSEYPIKCRITDKTTYVWTTAGIEEISTTQAWVSTSASIVEGNFIRYQGKEYEVKSIETKRGLNGRSLYKKVFLR